MDEGDHHDRMITPATRTPMTSVDYPKVIKDAGLSSGLFKVISALADTFAPGLSLDDAREITDAHFAQLSAHNAKNVPSKEDVMAFLTCSAAADMNVAGDMIRSISTQIAPDSFFKLKLILWALSTSFGTRG
jgi:hypothetical protein